MKESIDKAGQSVESASGFFDKVNAFIKKHPIWFIILVIIGLVYALEQWVGDEEVYDEPMYDEYYDEGQYEGQKQSSEDYYHEE